MLDSSTWALHWAKVKNLKVYIFIIFSNIEKI